MPESRWTTHSVRKPNPSLPMVTCPEKPPSKYLAIASATRVLMRSRSASPTLIFLPDTRSGMIALRWLMVDHRGWIYNAGHAAHADECFAADPSLPEKMSGDNFMECASGGRAQSNLLLPPPL